MNTSYHILPTCTCANHTLLTPGLICEICMGVVTESTPQPESHFEVDYFEALEEQLSKEDLAA